MNLPNKVTICGSEWKVTHARKNCGGRFRSSEKKITIGVNSKYLDEIYLHEVIEAIFANRGMRYDRWGLDREYDYLFSFTHHEFEQAIRDIAAALSLKFVARTRALSHTTRRPGRTRNSERQGENVRRNFSRTKATRTRKKNKAQI